MNAQKKCQVLWTKAEYKCRRPTRRILLHTYRLTSICWCIPCLSLRLHQTFRSCPDNVLTASFVNHPPHQSSPPTVSQMLLSAPAWRMINDVSHGCHGCKHSDGSIQSASDEVSWWHTRSQAHWSHSPPQSSVSSSAASWHIERVIQKGPEVSGRRGSLFISLKAERPGSTVNKDSA